MYHINGMQNGEIKLKIRRWYLRWEEAKLKNRLNSNDIMLTTKMDIK